MLKRAIHKKSFGTDGWFSFDPDDAGLIEAVYKRTVRDGEERLMFAVLENAVECFHKHILAQKPSRKQLFQEAEEWFLDKDGEALYSFENICETLGLHPDHIRKGLVVWKEARLKISSIQADPASRPKLSRSRVKHPAIRLSKTA